MKTIFVLLLLPLQIFSQCSFCTIEITGIDSSDYIVGEGEKLCIADTAILYGNIFVNGGLLCNSGTIINQYIIVRGHAISFDNYGYIKSDSISIETYSRMDNNGYIESNFFVNSDVQSARNNGVLTTNYFINKRRTTFTNEGDVYVAFDFINTDTSEFINYEYMFIGNDFRNSSRSQFTTKCIVEIGGSWYNEHSFISSYQNCAGFNVNGFTINSGWINYITNDDIDICDNGNPGQIDADHYPGSITPYITYCQCENTCQQTVSIDNAARLSTLSIFPNPASTSITLQSATSGQLNIYNSQGQLVYQSQNHQLTQSQIDISHYSPGIYYLTLTDGAQVLSKKFVKQ